MAESKSTERLAENKSTEPLAARQYATPEKLTKITQRKDNADTDLISGFCPSDQMFAADFLQIPSHDADTLAFGCNLPTIRAV